MINATHELSLTRQAELLDLSRSSLYYRPVPASDADLRLMRRIDELHPDLPFLGSRMLRDLLVQEGFAVGRKHVATLMRKMGLEAIYRRANTSRRHPRHPVFPYLLRGLVIDRPNQVWAADVTYIPMARGFLYLAAILDVASRKVLAFRLSNTLTADFCVEALEEALAKFGRPEVFNTDQGAQGDFQRSSQHLVNGGVVWDVHQGGLRNGQGGRRCGRQAGRVSINGKLSKHSGFVLLQGLQARTQLPRAECRSRLVPAGSARPAGWRPSAWLRALGGTCRSLNAKNSQC